MAGNIHALTPLKPGSFDNFGGSVAAFTNGQINATDKKIALKFYVATTSPITHINFNVDVTGTITGINFKAEIQTDSGDAPSGSVLGAATAEFAGLAADGMLGDKALASNTGNLSLNTPYWLVIYYSSGITLDASNHLNARTVGAVRSINDTKFRHFNGTDWTTVATLLAQHNSVLTHVDGSLTGDVTTAGTGNNASATDIFSTNRQGIKWKSGCQETIVGAKFSVTKTASPSALELVCYEGSTEKDTGTLAAAEVITNTDFIVILLDAPVVLSPDTDRYLVLRQAADGGDGSNDYDLRGAPVASHIDAHYPPDFRMVRGTGDDPTALTVDTVYLPRMYPLYADPASSLDSVGGGGGGVIARSLIAGGS